MPDEYVRSGTEEEYSTKEQLLQHVKDFKLELEEDRKRQEKKKTCEKEYREAAVVARYQAALPIQFNLCSENVDLVVDEDLDASSFLETSGTDGLQSSDCASPVRVPPSTADDNYNNELELKEEQIELERKKLELEEQKERNKEEQFKKQIELQERRLAFEEQERRERLIRDKENEKNLCNMVQMTFEMMKQMTEMINKI
ncbi:hypothetical protein JTE90_015722 [Oedothorax gibbosus]|uniref:Uncharacterized protein n=1 Tax=Oedothorax gibbosus TaxID=931172 RepID=A0AAV6TYH0_9ARAC|nr:hypothetical protein JTE90_015722 [Oedothorax gibbosus]